ncbi:MAG: cyanophycin synthetase [Candidatus Peribacteraceae bacterium]|jgi:UDP-N-acetylmuramate--alanine ligase|nr:cyanophycin synthetase [Candidatus Peribacteraceae bacterium]
MRVKIYCSGIGGIGLSAYAALQNANGHDVLGSDRALSALTNDLESQGISVSDIQDGSSVPSDADLFVYSEAIPEEAPERMQAKEYGIRQVNYFEALGELSKDFKVIAVCGTHGKSSTTAMAAKVLIDAGLDPTVIVGTKVPQLDGRNWRKGDSDIFLLETCEYRGSFLKLYPNIVLMANADGDHFDAFDSVEHYQQVFKDFLSRLPEDGIIITHMDDPDCMNIAQSAGREIRDVDQHSPVELSVPGAHMQANAKLVCLLAEHLGIEAEESLKGFTGTWRRMELKGDTKDGVTVIDDYAHHPIEISVTIAAAREAYPGRRIVCLYQPHTHDRTIRFYNDFLIAFDGADQVVVTDVYDARSDIEKDKVDVEQYVADIHAESVYGGSIEESKQLLEHSILRQGDVLIVMGAGDVTSVAQKLVS